MTNRDASLKEFDPTQGAGAVNTSSAGGLSSVDNALHLLTLVGERRVLRVAEAAEELICSALLSRGQVKTASAMAS